MSVYQLTVKIERDTSIYGCFNKKNVKKCESESTWNNSDKKCQL